MADNVVKVRLHEEEINEVLIVSDGTTVDIICRGEERAFVVDRQSVFAGCWKARQGVGDRVLDNLLILHLEREFGQIQTPSYKASSHIG